MNRFKLLGLALLATLVVEPASAKSSTPSDSVKKTVTAVHHKDAQKTSAPGGSKALKKTAARSKAKSRPAATLRQTSLKAPEPGIALRSRTIRRMEAGLRMPRGAAPLHRYVRLYTLDRAGAVEDLPVTTVRNDVVLPEGRRIVVGVLVLPGMFKTAQLGAPGVRIVEKSEMHQFFQGGCAVVNVVYDPSAKRTVASWCNYDDRADPTPIGKE